MYHTPFHLLANPFHETCDPAITSWVESAAAADGDFPLQNLPFASFRENRQASPWRIGVAIGNRVLDLAGAAEDGLLDTLPPDVLQAAHGATLNGVIALGVRTVGAVRHAVHRLLRADAARPVQTRVARHLLDADAIEYRLPASVGNFTDFFASAFHAGNVARLRNPDAELPSNYSHAPLAYHGRASSLVVSGTTVPRPRGPRRGSVAPIYQPTERLDYEVELGLLIGQGSTFGTPVGITAARSHLVGACLLNDWSARDIQAFESQPLGPFLSKSFATTLSPWMVTVQALEPFRRPAAPRSEGTPAAMRHLLDDEDQAAGAWSVTVEAWLTTRTMREMYLSPFRLSVADAASLFWTPAQLVTHQTSNGCNLQTGDLLATGTISGPEPGSFGSLLEITRGGREPLILPTGERRGFLEDDDEVTLRAYCSAPGAARIGFGECRGRIAPASPL
jgi:fumarylacetoacetase